MHALLHSAFIDDDLINDEDLRWHVVPIVGLFFWAAHTLEVSRDFLAFQYGALAGGDSWPRHDPPAWISTDALAWVLALLPYALAVGLVWAVWSRRKYEYPPVASAWHAARFAVYPALAVLAAQWYSSWEWRGLFHFLSGR